MIAILIVAFNLGLISTLHCVGMCGGILSAMMFSAPCKNQKKQRLINRSLSYNIGRITSYSLAGLICGLLGSKIIELTRTINAHLILQSIAALVLIALALNILGIFPFKKYLESIGIKIWKIIQPLGQRIYPIDSHWRAYLFGMVWGWLPCGLVYSALILSLSTATALDGMLTMCIFGLGTLPGMLAVGFFSDAINKIKDNKNLRRVTAFLMLLIAMSLPVSTYYFSAHHDHSASAPFTHQHH